MPRKKLTPVKILTLDTETINGLEGDIKRIAIYDGEKVTYGYKFMDVEPELLTWKDKGFDVHVYIHNLEFDARKIPQLFYYGNICWNKTKQINGRYVVIACRNYTIHDSFRLLPESLASLSKSFDLEHGKLDLWDEVKKAYPGEYKDVVDFFNRCDVDNELYLRYLGYDVMSLYELIEKLIEVSGLTPEEMVRRMTTASLSKYIFKNGYKGHQFKQKGSNYTDFEMLTKMSAWSSKKAIKDSSGERITYLDIENKIRQGYFGGRTEVFIPFTPGYDKPDGKKTVCWHYDVNSLYPSQMKGKLYPIGFPKYYNHPDLANMIYKKWLRERDGLGFITAQVFIPKQNIPPLPVHMGKLVFPTGYVDGTWGFDELAYAVEQCGVKILEVKEVIFFPETYPVFDNFISLFADMKTEAKERGEKALVKFSKLIQNTAYGWTVMSRDDKDELCDIEDLEESPQLLERLIYTNEDLGFAKLKSLVLSETIQPQVGAYVTVYARLALLKMMKLIEKLGGHVYYCDTDSVVTDIQLPPEYVHKSKLGLWDLEGELSAGIFLMPKVYTELYSDDFISKKSLDKNCNVKFKGVGKDTQKTFNYEYYLELLQEIQKGDSKSRVVEENHAMLPSIGFLQKTGKDINTVNYRDKKLNLHRKQKRKIDYINGTSEPWHMESIEDFRNFSFAGDVLPYDIYGNITDVCSSEGR